MANDGTGGRTAGSDDREAAGSSDSGPSGDSKGLGGPDAGSPGGMGGAGVAGATGTGRPPGGMSPVQGEDRDED